MTTSDMTVIAGVSNSVGLPKAGPQVTLTAEKAGIDRKVFVVVTHETGAAVSVPTVGDIRAALRVQLTKMFESFH